MSAGAAGGRHRIAPAIDYVLRPAASGKKADTPHQSTAMNRKREGLLYVPKLHGLHSPLARHEINKGAEIAGEIAKRPGHHSDVLAVQAELVHIQRCRESSSSALVDVNVDLSGAGHDRNSLFFWLSRSLLMSRKYSLDTNYFILN